MPVIPAKDPLPTEFPLAVVLRYRETPDSPWYDGSWSVEGVVAGARTDAVDAAAQPIHDTAGSRLYLQGGFHVRLFRDEAESYYQNLMAENPAAFVICQREDGGRLSPRLVTLSYAEATSYMEMEEEVFNVPLPPELYRWLEQYVLAHYVPEKRRKRRREDWKQAAPPPRHLRPGAGHD